MVFSLRSGIEERQIVSLSPLYSSSLIRTAFPSFVLMLTDSLYLIACSKKLLMNAAAALGIGSCWINRAMETFELPEGKALLAEWGLGENWKGVGNCILGYTDQAVLGDKARKEDRVLYV